MTTKRDRLVRSIGELLASHSQADWEFLQSQLEAVIQVAQECASLAGAMHKAKPGLKKTRPSRSRRREDVPARYQPRDPRVARLASLFADRALKVSIPTLRSIAISVGIKADLPRKRTELEDSILTFIDGGEPKQRAARIDIAIRVLEKLEPDQGNEYRRWVNLITER